MAAPARTLISAVRPHIPSIKFRYGATTGIADALIQPKETTIVTPPSTAVPSGKPIGSTARGSGIEFKDLPSRYQRKPMTEEEMDFIQRGGPA
ncbi:alpha-ketoglutarate dehydrogenase component 4-like [Argopecten irradians]|uniref:alpha-ketoglutarate dehydrogenase component 4-like n=1 Tax=Argopecten irradians TaxID=31199 RepID=UPI00371F2E92